MMLRCCFMLLGLLSLLPTRAWAQDPIFFANTNDTVRVEEGTILSIKGDLHGITQAASPEQAVYYNSDSIFMRRDDNLTAGGSIFNNTDTTLFLFIHPRSLQPIRNGYVQLEGQEQRISGTDSITFHHLLLRGTARKIMDVSASVSDTLDLGDRELDTQDNMMHVLDPALTAIRRVDGTSTIDFGGFVSSDLGGWLVRNTNLQAEYLFPTAEEQSATPRYRPIVLRPRSTSLHRYGVRFANVDPNTEGYDRARFFQTGSTDIQDSLCAINENYFHHIERFQGAANADITMFFDPVLEDSFTVNAHYRNHPTDPGLDGWENIFGTRDDNALVNGVRFSAITTDDWDGGYDTTAFALGYKFPETDLDPLPPNFCSHEEVEVFIRGARPIPQSNGTGSWWVRNGSDPAADWVRLPLNPFTATDSSFIPAEVYADPRVLDSVAGPLEVRYLFTDPFGCEDFTVRTTEILQSPIVEVEILNGDADFCGGDTLILRALPQGPNYEYEWTVLPSGDLYSRDSIIQVWQNLRLQLRIFDRDNGCSDTLDQFLELRVFDKPEIDAFLESLNTFYCEGETVTLRSNPPPGNNYTFEWWFKPTLNATDSTLLSTNPETPVTLADLGTGYYYVQVSDPDTPPICDTLSAAFYIPWIEEPDPTIELNGPTELCRGETTVLSIAPDSIQYFWFLDRPDGSTIPIYRIEPDGNSILAQETGSYYVRTNHPLCGYTFESEKIDITVTEFVQPLATVDREQGMIQDIFSFRDASVDDPFANDPIVEWFWQMGDGTEYSRQNVIHAYQEPGIYDVILTVRTRNGCQELDSLQVTVTERYILGLPNVFSPNGDGVNDVLNIVHQGIKQEIDMQIYDRWGAQVFQTRNLNRPWEGLNQDGEEVPEGVYVYVIYAKTLRDKNIEVSGTVTVLR